MITPEDMKVAVYLLFVLTAYLLHENVKTKIEDLISGFYDFESGVKTLKEEAGKKYSEEDLVVFFKNKLQERFDKIILDDEFEAQVRDLQKKAKIIGFDLETTALNGRLQKGFDKIKLGEDFNETLKISKKRQKQLMILKLLNLNLRLLSTECS